MIFAYEFDKFCYNAKRVFGETENCLTLKTRYQTIYEFILHERNATKTET